MRQPLVQVPGEVHHPGGADGRGRGGDGDAQVEGGAQSIRVQTVNRLKQKVRVIADQAKRRLLSRCISVLYSTVYTVYHAYVYM